jgi:hypothetical protein
LPREQWSNTAGTCRNIMTSEVEERIHRALKPHPLEKIEHGYRRVHSGGAGISTLRLLAVNEVREETSAVAIAEILA